MKRKKIFSIALVILLGLVLLVALYLKFSKGRPAPVPMKEKIMGGVDLHAGCALSSTFDDRACFGDR